MNSRPITTIHELKAPCGKELCACHRIAPQPVGGGQTRKVFANLRYERGFQMVTDRLVVEVPAEATHAQWLAALQCATDRLLRPLGAGFGSLSYRLDGTDKPLTLRERVQDRWHQFTWRGKAVTGYLFVPLWPAGLFRK
jgi:hypothetical protein